MTDEDLIARLREIQGQAGLFASAATDRIEALVKEAFLSKAAYDGVSSLLLSVQQDCIKERQRAERLEAALHNCVGMLDQLVAESGRSIEWGAEDPFRMGEWFEPEDLAQIEQARTALTQKGRTDG